MEVQIFGIRKNADTRKALRFFSERRIHTHFVDLAERAASLGELKRKLREATVLWRNMERVWRTKDEESSAASSR